MHCVNSVHLHDVVLVRKSPSLLVQERYGHTHAWPLCTWNGPTAQRHASSLKSEFGTALSLGHVNASQSSPQLRRIPHREYGSDILLRGEMEQQQDATQLYDA